MADIIQKTSNDYGIEVATLDRPVIAIRNGVQIAHSRQAKVMYETRLPPTIYFPRNDVRALLVDASDHKTFCPFKGTATYFHLDVDGEQISNAAWSYRNALTESKAIEEHVAFMPNAATVLELGENNLKAETSGNIAGPTIDWIMREAWLCASPEELTAAVARKLVEDGIAISRLSVMIWSLHPLIAGKNYIWSKKTDRVETFSPSYDIHQDPAFVNSPLRHVSNGLGGVRQKLGTNSSEFSFPIMEDLKAGGATDYVAMPLPFSNGQTNVLTLTCDHPKGFTTANLGLVFECSSTISRYYEVFALKENAQALLETYLGKRTGGRVLGGEIRRGDGDEIDAAILFCDLRRSSLLEEELGREAYIELLNGFFETTTEIINQHNGEVLKFIGDAVLAIFPSGDQQAVACQQSLNSATEIVGRLCGPGSNGKPNEVDCSIGIAFGGVTYGNVGSRERLDFTVIGKAANVAARLGDFGKLHGHRIVATGDIISKDTETLPLGRVDLHNVTEAVESYAILTKNT